MSNARNKEAARPDDERIVRADITLEGEDAAEFYEIKRARRFRGKNRRFLIDVIIPEFIKWQKQRLQRQQGRTGR